MTEGAGLSLRGGGEGGPGPGGGRCRVNGDSGAWGHQPGATTLRAAAQPGVRVLVTTPQLCDLDLREVPEPPWALVPHQGDGDLGSQATGCGC